MARRRMLLAIRASTNPTNIGFVVALRYGAPINSFRSA
jgi:hypothetical protein